MEAGGLDFCDLVDLAGADVDSTSLAFGNDTACNAKAAMTMDKTKPSAAIVWRSKRGARMDAEAMAAMCSRDHEKMQRHGEGDSDDRSFRRLEICGLYVPLQLSTAPGSVSLSLRMVMS